MGLLRSKILLVILILLIGWLGLSFIKINLHEDIVNKEIGDLEAKARNLEKNNSELEKFISYMTNPKFLEKQARILLNYKTPDEEVAFIYPDDSASDSLPPQSNGVLGQAPNYIKWWHYILDY